MSKAGNAGNDGELYQQMFGQLAGSDKEENDLALSALGPIVSGLMLERHFEPDVLSEKGLGFWVEYSMPFSRPNISRGRPG
jgi:hypothetical protein